MHALSFLTAFGLCLLLCGMLLPLLKRLKAGQEILVYVTEHSGKQGTPTMGGIAFIATVCLLSAIFCNFANRATAVAVAVFFSYGMVGFLDDFIKVKYKRNMGLHAYQKIIVQLAIAVLVALFTCFYMRCRAILRKSLKRYSKKRLHHIFNYSNIGNVHLT